MKGHLDACRYLHTGALSDCRCAEEEKRYTTLAKWSSGLFVFEFVAGWFSNSLALMSDAFHVLFDGMENILSALISRMSRESDENEKRIRTVGGVVSAVLLLCTASLLVREGWERFFEPREVEWFMVLAAAVGLRVNRLQRRHHHAAPVEHKNVTHFWQDRHLLSDTVVSRAVFWGGILMLASGWYRLDGLLSIGIGAWIAFLTTARLIAILSGRHHPR